MKQAKYYLGLLALVIMLSGCTTRRSEVVITNNCTAALEINFEENPITLARNQSYEESYLLDELLFFQETKELKIAYDGFIYLAAADYTFTLQPDQSKQLILENNRAGIEINNLAEIPIAEIRLRPIDSEQWSENYLQQPTVADNFSLSAKAEAVDLKLIDSTERVFVLNDTINLQVGQTALLFFDSFSLIYAE
ncbi:MAG: hypothetical protein R6U84_00740 [Candidatus Cloacimonadales bacterium]